MIAVGRGVELWGHGKLKQLAERGSGFMADTRRSWSKKREDL
jgi:hypothetical protein